MERYWLLEYKQTAQEGDGPIELISDWGRIGKKFKALEDLLDYLATYVCELGRMEKLTVDKNTLIIYGEQWYESKSSRKIIDKKGKNIDKSKLSKIFVEAKAYFVQEEGAVLKDYDKMKRLVDVV